MIPLSNVHVGDHVKIRLSSDPVKTSVGLVWRIFPVSDSDEITVLLKNGDKGTVSDFVNSEELIKKRIMGENQYTENKENFSKDVMRNKVIPQTVQSFLNSDGGHLYIGVRDVGTLKERLMGLDYDFSQISGHKDMTNDKLCDELERRIMDALERHLTSVTLLGPLVEIRFVGINDVQIAEINIMKSPKPWFFCHKSKNNKQQSFELWLNKKRVGERVLDDFYIRRGGSKKLLATHKEFYNYTVEHFKT